MNPDLNLAFLQVLESQSMNPDPDLESMINSDSDLESLLVLDSKLGLGIHVDLRLRIHEPRLGLGIPAGLRLGMNLESLNPDLKLAFLQVSDSQSMNIDSDWNT